ncbi:MAG: hypothetical protein CO162_04200 [bacterium (Candidatus Ratteibacteria) CG_4_9_14_3_um_filter_41_21]|nr:MAG: hypothetical protein AUJ76_04485 [Candidatus Omnitrophica bacterium CG1_02_41_171]PIW32143.1 MAG: hypothetical protein COW28_06560 [bacterium (Candidatus Ratteibacteria) CG15_BIG_FIL_POST_REV_8_21_14_020_41_12]PIW74549.1 MAG: hypothetical protein CO004_00100 [bacterium (Candidatus Ratteibacteria) CG_4_8_14_3_um_filter_41_36]PJA61839.1 MAG: hypothetical protein CO162_04200 [bacterium (Candidatus Ratteibacteria) CG_4_9_14_3_um_filter_41_21]HCG77309.1 hypothetical protein [bacterium]
MMEKIKELEQENQRLKKRNELLSKIIQQLNSSLQLSVVMEYVIGEVTKTVKAITSTIYTLTENGKIEFSYIYGAKQEVKEKLQKIQLEPGQGIAGKVIKEGRPYISLDTQDDPNFYKGIDQEIGFKTRSLICVPLKVKSEIIGALQVINKESEDKKFNQGDVELLEEIANHAALAIKNAQLYEEVKNWREFNEAIIENINEAVFVVDRGLKVIVGNRSLEEMSGGLYTKEYLKGRNAREIFPYLNLEPVYREVFQSGRSFQQSGAGGRLLNFKFIPRKTKNGEVGEIIVLVNKTNLQSELE